MFKHNDENFGGVQYLFFSILNIGVSIFLITFLQYFNKQLLALNKKEIQNIDTEGSSIFNEDNILKTLKSTNTLNRFYNYAVDIFMIYVFLIPLINFSQMFFDGFNETWGYYFILCCFLIFYYTYLEKTFGYTAGKALTHTKVVSSNGDLISTKQALIRSATRLVPLEQITAFNNNDSCTMWHDEWSGTIVVED